MPLTMRYNGSPGPIEAEAIRPDRLRGLTLPDIARQPVWTGNRAEELGQYFQLAGDPTDGRIELSGVDLGLVHRLAEGMESGELIVEGPAGHHVGSRMSGGRLELRGGCGHWCGAGMRGGSIRVHGSAGDGLGAAYPGERLGMREGVILVEGGAGNDVGLAMRRGLIAIRGPCGAGLGRGMVAGTIIVGGATGSGLGLGMKRGTLVLLSALETEPFAAFRLACRYRPNGLGVYRKKLSEWRWSGPVEPLSGRFDRYNGDLLEGGRGELLVAAR